jgi:hypothetical protein
MIKRLAIKDCRNCRHKARAIARDVCRAGEVYYYSTAENPYTGRIEKFIDSTSLHKSLLRQSVVERRAEGGLCGPEANLWAPNIRTRLWRLMTGGWLDAT